MNSARSETSCTYGHIMGRTGRSCCRPGTGPRCELRRGKITMNGNRKSDCPIVPEKLANEGGTGLFSEERVEGRGRVKRNLFPGTSFRTQRRVELSPEGKQIRQAAQKDKKQRFTALWHHVYKPDCLRRAFQELKRNASAGIDGMTWDAYEEELDERLAELSKQLRRNAYRTPSVKRTYIPKSNGSQRPIGMPTLEDKIVQRTVVNVLHGIYESDFKGFSYGFRPGRSAHDALDALSMGIGTRKISWVLDADIRGFFDRINHEWMIRFLEHRVSDKRVIRQVHNWLKAGVIEEGLYHETIEGTPQGGSASPLLANIYLHYALDLWADQWRRRVAQGEVIIVRYADDCVPRARAGYAA